MAANYWESTQRRHWQFTKDELATMRQNLEDEDPKLVQTFALPQLRHLNIYFNQQINRLGKRLGVRQQPMATAQVYTKRFYTRVEIRRTNPYLLMATALYLACKMEECPQHIRLITSEARSLWPNELQSIDTGKVGECEFFLISEMHSQLIVHQPYRTLTSLQGEFGLVPEEVSTCWSVINDHFMTDLPLLYPPHIIALTAMLLALVLRQTSGPGGSNANAAVGLAAATAVMAQAQARAALTGGASGHHPPTLMSQGSTGSQGTSSSQGDGRVDIKKATKVEKFGKWLAESNIDVEAMVDCTQELISFYECHEQYNDKQTREAINRFIKARGL
ncbi:hypothetical protein OQA88_2007 [Cercophora sp. LCS_1]